jgi:hypothetical protein
MTGRIEQFRMAVIAKIRQIAPELLTVEPQFGRFDLDELERTSIRCPAVRFAVLRSPLTQEANGQITADLACVAFVVTDGKQRDTAGWTIGEAIAATLHSSQMWGLTKIGAPHRLEMTPVISGALRDRGVAILAVEWRQSLRQLGEDIFDEAGVLLQELYVQGEEIDLAEGGVDG